MESFGKKISFLAKSNGLTQADMANLFNLSRPSVSGWFKGAIPHPKRLAEIAKYFNVSVDWLTDDNIEIREFYYKKSASGNTFGEFFKVRRKKSKFSGDNGAEDLAKILGVSRATIYNWEKSDKIPAKLDWTALNSAFGEDLEKSYYNRGNVTKEDVTKMLNDGIRGDIRRMSNEDALDYLIDLLNVIKEKNSKNLKINMLRELAFCAVELAKRFEKEL